MTRSLPSTPADSVVFRDNGANIIYVDWDNNPVVVARRIQGMSVDRFLGKVLVALKASE
jgi:hypothetical protein